MTINRKTQKALIELVATSRAVVSENVFGEKSAKEISEAAEIVEQFLFDCEVDPTDWEYIEKFGDALIAFGKESA